MNEVPSTYLVNFCGITPLAREWPSKGAKYN